MKAEIEASNGWLSTPLDVGSAVNLSKHIGLALRAVQCAFKCSPQKLFSDGVGQGLCEHNRVLAWKAEGRVQDKTWLWIFPKTKREA